jgi:hypothetical protein
MFLAVIAVMGSIFLALILFVSRKRSNVARWVLTILTIAGIFLMVLGPEEEWVQSSISSVISAIQGALQILAIYFVFRPDAETWFKK